MEPATLKLVINYSPGAGVATVEDQWEVPSGPTSLALVITTNVLRSGRESLYREIRQTVSQYLDIMDGRWQEQSEPF